jgi:hypothetical protein
MQEVPVSEASTNSVVYTMHAKQQSSSNDIKKSVLSAQKKPKATAVRKLARFSTPPPPYSPNPPTPPPHTPFIAIPRTFKIQVAQP